MNHSLLNNRLLRKLIIGFMCLAMIVPPGTIGMSTAYASGGDEDDGQDDNPTPEEECEFPPPPGGSSHEGLGLKRHSIQSM